ncbi:MAG: serine/threonine protein kinase [Wenzhouxiangella sp.]|nr:serine/threonine protein kinase [Wenzhouxiangella sp.]
MDKAPPGAGPTFFNLSSEVEALLFEALTLPPEARPDFLEAATDNPALKAQVKALLEAHAQADAELGMVGAQIEALGENPNAVLPFSHAGPWRLTGLLGHGGMSVVYRVERDDGEFEQAAALKLLPSGPLADAMVQRFRVERSILARLEHPNLARLLDGGMTQDGLPYLVMELVEGMPIDQYCDQYKLSVDDRLGLFVQVLQVVQYAHQNLVVHRDLKPSNILVTARGQVKLLDFGIAKVLDEELASGQATELTRLGGRPMTLAWSSPEQITGSAITTATDVYTLGLLLYKLLTGQLPFSGRTAGELSQAIQTESPASPSASIAAAPNAAKAMSSRPERLRRRLRGDLDNIVLSCLNKDPQRRYSTVAELADDLDRHQRKLPVRARPDRWRYRAGRFVARHRFGVSLALTLPLVTAIATGWHVDRLANERDRAEAAAVTADREAAKSRAVSDFLVDLFDAADPMQSAGSVSVLDILQRGLERIDRLDSEPLLQAELLSTLSQVLRNTADHEAASALTDRALERALSTDAAPPALLARLWIEVAGMARRVSQHDKSLAAARHAINATGRVDSPELVEAFNELGLAFGGLGQYDESEQALLTAIETAQRVEPEGNQLAGVRNNLAYLYRHIGRHQEAHELFGQVMEYRLEHLGKDDPLTLTSMGNYAATLMDRGELDEAEALTREVLALYELRVGPDHHRNASLVYRLGLIHQLRGQLAEAETMIERALAQRRSGFGDSSRTANILIKLAEINSQMDQHDRAEQRLREALDILVDNFGADHPAVGSTLELIAEAEQATLMKD